MARDYELGIVINPDVGDEQARTIVERVTQFVSTNGGQVVRVNAWGRRHLAYPIQHHRDGLFFWFDLMLPPETVAGLERNLHVNEDVIRHLVKQRDPRVIAQVRQREAEEDAQAAARAAAQAAAAAARAAAAEAQAEAPTTAPEAQAEAAAPEAQAEAPAAGEEEEARSETLGAEADS
jgi:small subunit ribosomal protein S6